MLKLFLKFYFIIAIPLVLLFIPALNPAGKLVESWAEELYVTEFGGVFRLLERELKPLPEDAWEKHIESLNEHFGTPIYLKGLAELKLNKKKLKQLKNGKTVLLLGDINKLYKQVGTSQYAFVFYTAMLQDDADHELLLGPVYLIDRLLADFPPEDWDEVLEKNQLNSNVTVKIIAASSLSEQLQKDPRLQKGKLVEERLEKHLNTFYFKTPDPDYIYQFGPVDERNFHDRIESMSRILPASFLALGILLLAIPLWGDIKKLRGIAEDFSQGEFNSRVKIRRSSVLVPLARAFNHLGGSVQRLLHGQKELSNAVSHEIKTPLARLRFAVEMLRDKPTKTDADRFLNDIDRDVKEIESLIDEILLHSRYDRAASEQSFEYLDLVALLNELLEVFQDYHPQVILKNTLPEKELQVALDSTGIKHAMNNLLNNAARYAKSTIKVSLDKTADNINIKVEDDGDGIAKEDFQRVFEPFIRLDESRQRKSGEVLLAVPDAPSISTIPGGSLLAVPDAPSISTIPGGSGLGLSIVERIAQWHGGSVSCEKSDLGGAMFSFQIPLRS